MAWITKKHKDKQRYYFNNVSAKYYGTTQWHMLRNNYIGHHPLCERCLELGKVTPAEHVHHIIPFLTGKDDKNKWTLLLDEHNLMSLCANCHHIIHEQMRNNPG